MPTTGKKVYYWDSSLFLAWLMNEPREPEVVEGIEEVAREVNDNKAVLITSVITETEVLQGRLSEEARKKLQDFFKRKNVVPIVVDQRISSFAGQIREYYLARGIKISTPDSIHLATAIIYKADELHTTDGSGERRRPADLISLNGNVMGKYPLKILLPRAAQVGLFPGHIPPSKSGSNEKKQK